MEWDQTLSDEVDVAARISAFKRDELDNFIREHLRRRDLHLVVANLNASVLSKDTPRSARARSALERMGFAD